MSNFSRIARSVQKTVASHVKLATSDRDAEWQRVNSYIADVLKDAHVLYAKLARLQGDFTGVELDGLEKISEDVLSIGGKLSSFSKAFYEGKASMSEEETFGEETLFGTKEEPSFEHEAPSEFEEHEEAPEHEEHEEEHEEKAPKKPAPKGEGEDVDIDFDYSEEGEEGKEEEKED